MRNFAIFVCFVLGACTPEQDMARDLNLTEEKTHSIRLKLKEGSNQLRMRGTIVYKDLEGGFYGFDADNGKKYQPKGLPREYRKNGLVVEISGSIDNQMSSIQQYGEILKVSSIKVIDDSKVKQQNYD